MIKYIWMKVFVTDGLAELTAGKQKQLLVPTVWAELSFPG